jgi:hypothetical protein
MEKIWDIRLYHVYHNTEQVLCISELWP